MNSIIKQELIRFFGNCESISENEYIVHVGPSTSGFDLRIMLNENSLMALNILVGLDSETIEILCDATGLESDSVNIEITEDGALNIRILGRDPIKLVKSCINLIKHLYMNFINQFPLTAWRVLGEIQVKVYNYRISVLSPEYNQPVRTGWRGDIIVVMPGEDGWILSSMGMDNVKLPILSVVKSDRTLAYAPAENNVLKPYNLTEVLNKLRELVDIIGAGIVDLPADESELLVKIGNLLSLLDIIRASLGEGALPLAPININEEIAEKVKPLLEKLTNDIGVLRKILGLDEAIRRKIAMRMAVDYARSILQRESGVIISNVRKVSKLGAGKAVYIGKEELKILPLGEKVLVSVVEEKGKKKIVIEPL